MVDEALASALETYSNFNPLPRTYSYTSTGDRRQSLPADLNSFGIRRIEWVSTDFMFSSEVAYYAYRMDEQWVFETTEMVIPINEILSILYDTNHTIDGHKSAAGTTVPAADVQLLAIGAAGHACRMRATSQSETNNLNPNETQALIEASLRWLAEFEIRLGSKQQGFVMASWDNPGIDRNY
jgi:hypothetical protein